MQSNFHVYNYIKKNNDLLRYKLMFYDLEDWYY